MQRLLLVDNLEKRLGVISRAAQGPGRGIEKASTVEKALELIGKFDFDLIVTDLWIAPASKRAGFDVARAALKKDPDVPVIIVTKYANPDRGTEAIGLKVFDFIDFATDAFKPEQMLKHKIDLALRFRTALRHTELTPA